MSNRILDYPEATAITSDDYILLDNAGTGAKCIKASALNINMDNYTIKEARGSIASFDDGEDLPLAFMGAYITAIQDLHGYEYPWVGGAGKNLFDYTHFQFVEMGYINGYGVWEGSRTIKNYPTDNIGNEWNSLLIDVSALRSQNVSFSGFVGSTAIGIIDENFKVLYTMGTSVPTSGSVDLSQYPTAKYFVIGFYFIGYDFDNAQFELGTTVTTFSPYSNICPISGHTETNVSVVGKNLVNISDKTMTSSGYVFAISGLNIRKGIYTFSAKTTTSASMSIAVYGNGVAFINTGFNGKSISFTATDTITDIRLYTSGAGTYEEMMLEEGSTATSYEPYNGSTITIQLGDTYYGGKLDVVSGVMTVDRAYVDLGTLDWQYSSISERFYVGASDLGVKATDASTPFNAISSALIAKSYNEIEAKTVDYAIAINPNATQLFARYSSITSASDFITAMNGVQLVYELATPLTYQLTPTMIYSLIGENNIFADTGDSIVDYRKLWVKPEM